MPDEATIDREGQTMKDESHDLAEYRPGVQVLIANYNGAHTLAPTIRSVLDQTFTDFELVVVDNVSTDDTAAVVASFDDPRLILRPCEEHLPMAENWTRAARLGETEIVAMIHSDDIWHREFLAVLVERLRQDSEADAVICQSEQVDAEGRPFLTPIYRDHNRDHGGRMARDDYDALLCQMIIRPCSWLARRRLFDRHGFSGEFYFASDWEFWLRAFEDSVVLSEPTVLCSYRIHQMSRTFSEAQILRRLDEEISIVGDAIRRSNPSPGVQAKAWTRVDERHVRGIVLMARMRRFRLAGKLIRQGLQRRGAGRLLRGGVALVLEPVFVPTLWNSIKRGLFPPAPVPSYSVETDGRPH